MSRRSARFAKRGICEPFNSDGVKDQKKGPSGAAGSVQGRFVVSVCVRRLNLRGEDADQKTTRPDGGEGRSAV
jgi:hypothetical protein